MGSPTHINQCFRKQTQILSTNQTSTNISKFMFRKKPKPWSDLIQFLNNFNPHSVSSPNNGLRNTLQWHVLAIRVRLLNFRHLINMFKRQRLGHHVPRPAATGLDPCRFFKVPRNWRRLNSELERVFFERSNRHRHRRVWLVLLCSGIEILAESHQIESILTQSWTHRRSRPCATG